MTGSKTLPERVCSLIRVCHALPSEVRDPLSWSLQVVICKGRMKVRLWSVLTPVHTLHFFTTRSIKRGYRIVTVCFIVYLGPLWKSYILNDGNVISPFPVQSLLPCSPAGISGSFLFQSVLCTVTVGICKFAVLCPKDVVDKMLALFSCLIFFPLLWQLSSALGSSSSLSKLSSRRYSHSGYISQKGQLLLPLTEAS